MGTLEIVFVWVVLFAAVLIFEFYTIARTERGDTLSENVWKLMRMLPAAMLIMGLWFWLTWHWFIEPRFFESLRPPVWIDDYIATGLGMLSAFWLKRE